MLTVSNWHFVRDNQTAKVPPVCTPKDCVVGIKLSSTSFKSLLDLDEKEFNYDKNGLLLPYILFMDLLSHGEFSCDYMDSVKQEFEERGNKVDDHDNEEEVNKILAAAKAKTTEEYSKRDAAADAFLKNLETICNSQGVSRNSQLAINPRSSNFSLDYDEPEPQNESDKNQQVVAVEDEDDDEEEEIVSRKKSRKRYPSPSGKPGPGSKKGKQ